MHFFITFAFEKVFIIFINHFKLKEIQIMKTLGYIAAVIGGAVAGATAALLLAPEKGEDTRAKLQDYAKEYYDKIDFKKTAEDIQNKVKVLCFMVTQINIPRTAVYRSSGTASTSRWRAFLLRLRTYAALPSPGSDRRVPLPKFF